ncbi:MAG: hypothetical protein IPJ30_05750 [Acidobacteria bacterium]|nr:hypothetical protein [Acidobacteriota bacterium]
MRTRLALMLLGLAGGLIFVAGLSLQTAAPGERVIPEVIVLAEKAALGKVTFNHGNHITKRRTPTALPH